MPIERICESCGKFFDPEEHEPLPNNVSFCDSCINEHNVGCMGAEEGCIICKAQQKQTKETQTRTATFYFEILSTLKGCRDMLRESAKMFRLGKLEGHAVMADRHASAADKILKEAVNA